MAEEKMGSNEDIRPAEGGVAYPVITTYCNPPDENGVRVAMPEDWAALPPGAYSYLYVTPAFVRPSDVVVNAVQVWNKQGGPHSIIGYCIVRAEG